MKALRSPLVKRLLADPVARNQLRDFAESTAGTSKPANDSTVELTTNGTTLVYRPVIVAKAA